MNEKILVEGKFLTLKLNPASLICFLIAGLAFISCFIVATIYGGSPSWAFRGMHYGYYWFFIGIIVFVIVGLIFAALPFELTVTNSKVVGKTLFGKRVDLPISQISVAGTGMFKRVSIATSSGFINFYGVANQNEVFSIISELIVKRQEETKTATVKAPESSSDELKKYKELLDSGVITQEEFDAKKKQILGI